MHMHGYFVLYKPKGISSNKALIIAKNALANSGDTPFNKIKMGHAGTLDPLAEGVLLVSVGRATKMMDSLLKADKKYIADIFLGKTSTTDDEEGIKKSEMIRSDIPLESEINTVIDSFCGEISQIPPAYSALKIKGKRACDRVRQGETVIMKPRNIKIFTLNILEYNFPHLRLQVHCSSGTYIRSLARDIGEKLGTGGYLSALRRISIGNAFVEQSALSPEKVTPQDLQPFLPEHFALPKIEVDERVLRRLNEGQKIKEQQFEKIPNAEYLLIWNNRIQGKITAQEGILIPKKMGWGEFC